MSFGQSVFGRIYGSLRTKARNSEELGSNVITNFKNLRRWLFYGGVGYCAGSVFQHYILEHGQSEGMSMFPTMPTKTPFTVTSKLHAHGKNMAPGDIVLFISPIFRAQPYGKRIIGMPGDYIVLDAHQAPSVGGAPVPGITDWRSKTEIEDGVELKERTEPMMIEVPQGHMYAVGDNLAWSRDSRFFGPVPLALVKGKQLLHSNGSMTSWSRTAGDQLRRIPKDQEEEYLRAWQQKPATETKADVKETTPDAAEKVD